MRTTVFEGRQANEVCAVRRVLPSNKQSGGLFTVRAAKGANPVRFLANASVFYFNNAFISWVRVSA